MSEQKEGGGAEQLPPIEPKYYTVPEVAQLFKVTRATVYKWMSGGAGERRLGFVVIGGDRRVPESALRAFIQVDGTQPNRNPTDRRTPGTMQLAVA